MGRAGSSGRGPGASRASPGRSTCRGTRRSASTPRPPPPPQKHAEDRPPGEVALEEVYYYRAPAPEAFAVQRLYSPARRLDLTVTVHDGDVLLVPFGYHAFSAAPGYDFYYFNALAGDRHSMAASDDPALAWIRSSWASMAKDPRVPLVTR